MITLFNPTNEDLKGHHAGENVKIISKSKLKVEDGRGNHLLNNLGPRGLTSLEYGDDEKVKAAEGRKRNREFKLKQVLDYNSQNETRESSGLVHIDPPQHVKDYADELKIDLKKSYTVKAADEFKSKSTDDERFEKIEGQISELVGTIGTLVKSLSNQSQPKGKKT